MDEVFKHRNMSEAFFQDVNLRRSTFRNVNLSEVKIQNASLRNVSINETDIAGLTISGFNVEKLIEAELDRRDPERLNFVVRDLYNPASVRVAMDNLEALRVGFRHRLRKVDSFLLLARPAPAKWSAIEHVRHMLFAEELHLNQFILQNDSPWHKMGLLSSQFFHRQGFEGVGDEPSGDLEQVFLAWDQVHARTRAFVATLTPDRLRWRARNLEGEARPVGEILQNLARHDLHHIRLVDAALVEQNVLPAVTFGSGST